MAGIEHAPTLRNFLERQTYRVRERAGRLRAAACRQPAGRSGARDRAGLRGRAGARRARRVVRAGGQLGANQRARPARAPGARAAAAVSTRSRRPAAGLARRRAGGAGGRRRSRSATWPTRRRAPRSWPTIVPFFVLMAVLYGALNAALDTTAGERERGSLEPLLMNPASRLALVMGKWGAVASVGMLIAVLSCLSFLPGAVAAAQRDAGGDVPLRHARGGPVPGACCCRWRRRCRR